MRNPIFGTAIIQVDTIVSLLLERLATRRTDVCKTGIVSQVCWPCTGVSSLSNHGKLSRGTGKVGVSSLDINCSALLCSLASPAEISRMRSVRWPRECLQSTHIWSRVLQYGQSWKWKHGHENDRMRDLCNNNNNTAGLEMGYYYGTDYSLGKWSMEAQAM